MIPPQIALEPRREKQMSSRLRKEKGAHYTPRIEPGRMTPERATLRT